MVKSTPFTSSAATSKKAGKSLSRFPLIIFSEMSMKTKRRSEPIFNPPTPPLLEAARLTSTLLQQPNTMSLSRQQLNLRIIFQKAPWEAQTSGSFPPHPRDTHQKQQFS
ncbi:hypothetical protein AXF42_Ash011629 [Apostasia shenzhenica]|uniref:Uncharacterized protein n=1 Tax=Apostasia shenzhenica TaxID=1088818 RepID=A0A2H9ZUI4_9ASPA|nr:hypothetical protein AXF42_Ash011629 [Apostasia shenzhenica]